MSKPKGENVAGPTDVFATLTNYSVGGTTSIGVQQYWKEVSFSQAEVEDPNTNCSVLCRYQPRKVLEPAGVVH